MDIFEARMPIAIESPAVEFLQASSRSRSSRERQRKQENSEAHTFLKIFIQQYRLVSIRVNSLQLHF